MAGPLLMGGVLLVACAEPVSRHGFAPLPGMLERARLVQVDQSALASLAGHRVAVTGGLGFVGRAVVRQLEAAGARTVTLHRPGATVPSGSPGAQAGVDLADAGAVAAVVAGVDAIVHLAAEAGGVQFQQGAHAEVFRRNCAATAGVLEAAVRAGVPRLFLASSGVVYADPTRAEPLTEHARLLDAASAPTGYAWSKSTDEAMARWYASDGGSAVVIGRLTNVYGPGGPFDEARSTVVHALVRRAVETPAGGRLVVWGDGNATRSFLYIEDAARAILTTLVNGEGNGVYNIDTGEPITVARLAHVVRDAVDPALELAFDPAKPSGAAYRVLDGARLAALRFRARVGLEEGVARTVEAYRSH